MLKFIVLFGAVLVLGILLLDMYISNTELENRLSQAEKTIAELLIKFDTLHDTVHARGDVKASADPFQVGMHSPEPAALRQFRSPGSVLASSRAMTRRKRAARERRAKSKRCKNCLPSVEFEGSGGYQLDKDPNDMSGLWRKAGWLEGASTIGPYKFNKIERNGIVEIKKPGLYIVYAQMNLIGAPGGFNVETLSKTDYKKHVSTGNVVATCKDFTQTDSSNENYTCFTMRVVALNEKEKGGFYIKKRTKTPVGDQILASCMCGPSEGTAHHACFTMRLVKLDKKDSVFVDEMHSKWRGLYTPTTAYFGLIRVGNT